MNSIKKAVTAIVGLVALTLMLPVHAEQMHHEQMHGDQHQSTMMSPGESENETMPHEMHQTPGHAGEGTQHMQHGSEHHADHNMTSQVPSMHSSISLQPLTQLPPSGKAREAGYDGRYAMEHTSVDQPLSTRCALASRGLVMLDNASWKLCGGKPGGWPKGSSKTLDKVEHHIMHH